jgi:endonuclease YncB( thermonuclease family)
MNLIKIFFIILLLPLSGIVFAGTLNCPCKVVEVSDGDTVYVLDQYKSSRKIWLAGIDAPQLQQNFGAQARQNLIKLVKGKYIDVEYIQRDRYGRIIAKLIKDGIDMNLQQIKDGYAWHYSKKENDQSEPDKAQYSTAESIAKSKRLGLWSINSVPPWEYRNLN